MATEQKSFELELLEEVDRFFSGEEVWWRGAFPKVEEKACLGMKLAQVAKEKGMDLKKEEHNLCGLLGFGRLMDVARWNDHRDTTFLALKQRLRKGMEELKDEQGQ